MKLLSFTLSLLFTFLFLVFFNSTAFAEEYYFQEEFNQERLANTLDPNKWTVYPNNIPGLVTILESGGSVNLQTGSSTQFPYVVSKNNPIPSSGDFSVEIAIQYTSVVVRGTGIVLSIVAPSNNIPELEKDTPQTYFFGVWQGTDEGFNITHDGYCARGLICPTPGTVFYHTSSPDLSYYIIKIEYQNNVYQVYVNNTKVFTSPFTQIRPQAIWFGNPTNQGSNYAWTRLKIDYIRVKDLTPPKTPLILIPGIGGSELKVNEDTIWSKDDGHGGIFNHIYPAGEKVWVNEDKAGEPGHDDYFDVLRMKTDGVTSEANLGLTGNLYSGAYQETINFFTSDEVGYTLNQDFFVFPYDWRLDIAGTAALLDAKIQQIKQQTGMQKVDIVAHSMGGLIARNYIADLTHAQNVRKLFALGTPHLGSPHFLKVLRYGDCLTRLPLLQQPICIGLTYSEVKDVIRNMISGFQLAPSQTYFNIYNSQDNLHPFPYADIRDIDNNGVTGPLNYAQTKTLLTNLGHNTGLFIPSETFHNLDNNLTDTNNVDVINIVGSGMATLGQIIEKYKIDFAGVKIPQKEEIKINGDDTVPLLSAAFGATKVFYAKQKHGELPNPGPAMNLVKNILDDNSQIPVGISHDPYPFKGTQVSVHSPVNIHVYDLNGNHTGPLPNGDFEVNIPGSSYDTLDDAKFIFLPDNGVYTINFEAIGQGNFDFKIRKYEDDISSESILYKDIPITSTSIGQTILDTSSLQPPTLQIDQQTITPTATIAGNENFDQILPQLSLDATPKLIWPPNNKMVDVNIIGSSFDENLYRTIFIVEDEYGLVEPTITQFNQIIKLQAFRREDDQDGRIYTIRAIAEDLAGNTTESQVEIVIPHDQRDKN